MSDHRNEHWRKLCARMADELDHYRIGMEGDDRSHPLAREARAALDQPEPEVAGPSDEELLGVAAQAIEPYDEIRLDEYEAENNCAIEVYGSELIAFARAVLGYWGRPAPAPAGEVAELVEFLHIYGDEVMDEYGDVGEHDQLTRAAELLQRHPAPVPVAERLPGPEDCLDEGWAWFFSPRVGWRQAVLPVSAAYTHWLPAHALPLPSGEVER